MLKLPAKLENLEQFLNHFREFACNHTEDAVIKKVELALEEALVNIISYAYPDSEGDIEFFCECVDGKQLVLKICDSGVPFDVLEKEDPDVHAEIEDRDIGGLGVYFIKQLMDEVEYRHEGGCNILTLKLDVIRKPSSGLPGQAG